MRIPIILQQQQVVLVKLTVWYVLCDIGKFRIDRGGDLTFCLVYFDGYML